MTDEMRDMESTIASLTATIDDFRQQLEACVSRIAVLELNQKELLLRSDPRNYGWH
jgi:regulator of replication initiation timing